MPPSQQERSRSRQRYPSAPSYAASSLPANEHRGRGYKQQTPLNERHVSKYWPQQHGSSPQFRPRAVSLRGSGSRHGGPIWSSEDHSPHLHSFRPYGRPTKGSSRDSRSRDRSSVPPSREQYHDDQPFTLETSWEGSERSY